MKWFLVFMLLCNIALADDYVVATIGDQKINYSEIEKAAQGLNRFLKENFDSSREWRLNYIRQYVAREAVAKRAIKEGLDKDKDIISQIEQAKQGIIADALLNRELAKIKYDESDLKEYYSKNVEKYRMPCRAKFSYIKVATKAEADAVIRGLAAGKRFEKLAGKNLARSANWQVKDGPFVPEVKGASADEIAGLFSLGIGGCSEIIGGEGGYFIFRMDEKEDPKDRSFDEVKTQVEMQYRKIEQDKVINQVVKDTFAKEKVVINEAEIR